MIELHTQERVLGSYRKTWVVFAAAGAVSALLIFAPLIFFPALFRIWEDVSSLLSSKVLFLATALWWWTVWMLSFLTFVNYYLDVFIITNERIINIEQLRPFSRRISELRLERVQDVTIEQHGFLATLLHFGDIRVQTAGEVESFVFTAIPNPVRVKEVIMAAHRDALSATQQNTFPQKAAARGLT